MAQAQILIKGESVYKCDTCNRKVRVATSKDGIDVVQRCIITHGCKGKLYRVRDARDVNSTSAFPAEVPGVQDWFQRRVVYDHSQPIKSQKWYYYHLQPPLTLCNCMVFLSSIAIYGRPFAGFRCTCIS